MTAAFSNFAAQTRLENAAAFSGLNIFKACSAPAVRSSDHVANELTAIVKAMSSHKDFFIFRLVGFINKIVDWLQCATTDHLHASNKKYTSNACAKSDLANANRGFAAC